MKMTRRIAIIGGGNIGTLMAAEFARRGNEVTIYTRDLSKWSDRIAVYSRDDEFLYEVDNISITDSLERAVATAEIIWVTTPTQTFESLAERLEALVSHEQILCVVPGSGAELEFNALIDKGCTFVGLEKVHSISRLKEYGRSVFELGKKTKLNIGVIPSSKKDECVRMVEETIGIETAALPNYLTVTMTPVNAFLHTSRLYSMFAKNAKDEAYDRNPLFYKEWDDESSEIILECDRELKQLCDSMTIDLSGVVLLHEFYKSETAEELTRTLQELPAFQKIVSPMYEEDGKFYVDWKHRYFSADFPYGLKLLVDIAKAFDAKVPCMERMLDWYLAMEPDAERFELGLSRDEIISLYAE